MPLDKTIKGARLRLVHGGFSGPAPESFERGDHSEIADRALEDLRKRYKEIVTHGGQLYGFKDGLFRQLPPLVLDRVIRGYAGAALSLGGKDDEDFEPTKVLRISWNTIVGVRKILAHETDDPQFFENAPDGIPFKNQFARVDASGLYSEPLSIEHRARYRYPFELPEKVQAPQFFGFLNAIFRDDRDRAEKVAAVQEFMGAAIIGVAPKYERVLMPYGPGSNGKTRLCDVIRATMPPDSVVSLPPALMSDQYSRSKLADARLNIHPDIPDDALVSDVKGIVSGELTHARDPGGAAICFVPRAAHVFGCNRLPHTKDTTDGFWRRWLILHMTRDFSKDPRKDVNILAKILPEIASVVRWALDGAVRLLGQHDYTLPTSHELAIARWRGKEDGVRLFIETRTRSSDGEPGTDADRLRHAYNEWITAHGGEMLSPQKFGREMAERGYPGTRTMTGKFYGRVLIDEKSSQKSN